MNRLVDIEKSDGYFVIKIINGEQVQINVKDMQENSPILLAVADNNTPLMKEITIPGTGFSFVLVEKNMNLVFKQKSLLDTKFILLFLSPIILIVLTLLLSSFSIDESVFVDICFLSLIVST